MLDHESMVNLISGESVNVNNDYEVQHRQAELYFNKLGQIEKFRLRSPRSFTLVTK